MKALEKVTRTALQNAASIAGLMLTTAAILLPHCQRRGGIRFG